jgi:hypothetical protein
LRCSVCSAAFDDGGFVLQCPIEHTHGLLVSDYSAKQFERDEHDESIYRYWRWLPIVRRQSGAGGTITYRSLQLSASAGNTAAAFGRMCSENEIACLIVIAERALNRRTGALVSAGSNGLSGPLFRIAHLGACYALGAQR